jgi:hypothetical protein
MDDFLKKLKKAVDSGEANPDIVNRHYDVLQGADMIDLLKANKNEEEKSYENEVLGFLGHETTSVEHIQTGSPQAERIDETAYLDEIQNYSNDEKKKNRLEVMEQARIDAEAQDKKRKKRELIEMNNAHIKMIQDENEQLQKKILKNNELIEYLKIEMERE